MIFLQRTLATTAVAAAAVLGLAPLAHADVVVFDGSSWSATTAGGTTVGPAGIPIGYITSTTSGGSTTLSTATNPGGGVAAGSDWVNLSTPITSGSGTWTLNITQQMTVSSAQDSFVNVAFGLGNFTNVNNVITNAPAGNGITGPGVLDSRSRLGSPGVSYAGYTTGSSFFTVQDLNEPQSGPSTFKIVLNTNMPHWTLDVFKNGQQMGNEVVYATNPGTLNEFGISLNGGADPSSVTYSNISLTDSQQVAAVPEASTWAMMMLGFAGLGLLSYRRTRRNGGLNLRFA